MEDVIPVVIDLGSSHIKAGFGGDDVPREVFPNLIGSPRHPIVQLANEAKSYCKQAARQTSIWVLIETDSVAIDVGDEAQAKRGILSLKYPIENGTVMDWDALELILHDTFYQKLRVATEEHSMLISEHPLGTWQDRWKMCQVMFEVFDVPAYYAALGPILATYASGRGTALTVDIGDGVTTMTYVHYGYAVRQCTARVNFSGRDLTYYMQTLLTQRGYYLNRTSDFESVRDMKEKLCYVPLDYDAEVKVTTTLSDCQRSYELPDGQIITLGHERFTCPEALFQPWLVGREGPGVHELVFNAAISAPKDLQRDLFGNIVLCGGSTMFPGFADRLLKELNNLAPHNMKCKVIAPPERKYLTWIGGSILSSLSNFQQKWISKQEYDECGPSIITRRMSDDGY